MGDRKGEGKDTTGTAYVLEIPCEIDRFIVVVDHRSVAARQPVKNVQWCGFIKRISQQQ
jgi:hypothetical protein